MMTNYLFLRQINPNVSSNKFVTNLLKNRFLKTNEYSYLYELIKYKNVELYLKVFTKDMDLLVCPLVPKDDHFYAEFCESILNEFTGFDLKIFDKNEKDIFETELVKLSPSSFLFYPFDHDIQEMQMGKLKWEPKEIEIFEKILDMEIIKKNHDYYQYIFPCFMFFLFFLYFFIA
ncbi:hypothetical protein CPAV1605_476 [seawater metagenome]|uniref:Uncharacterized protein n=1 Tax=seawater metagenome TaxID=1561972 RepID=A0A5E8CHN6_9ZZZZ